MSGLRLGLLIAWYLVRIVGTVALIILFILVGATLLGMLVQSRDAIWEAVLRVWGI